MHKVNQVPEEGAVGLVRACVLDDKVVVTDLARNTVCVGSGAGRGVSDTFYFTYWSSSGDLVLM